MQILRFLEKREGRGFQTNFQHVFFVFLFRFPSAFLFDRPPSILPLSVEVEIVFKPQVDNVSDNYPTQIPGMLVVLKFLKILIFFVCTKKPYFSSFFQFFPKISLFLSILLWLSTNDVIASAWHASYICTTCTSMNCKFLCGLLTPCDERILLFLSNFVLFWYSAYCSQ